MSASRRSILAAAGGGLASLPHSAAAQPTSGASAVAHLVQLSEDSNAALMAGDIDRYLGLISLTDDFTLMSPFGGEPSRGADYTDERMRAMGRFFRNGTLKMQLVAAYGSPDLVVLALVERAHVEVGGLPAQDWALRVTLVYRRDGARWLLAHRHADPLVQGVSLEEAAALARRKGA
jgi:ketosteroid isomerase-like protein